MLEKLELYPSREFWESDLEMPINKLLQDFQNVGIRISWLNSLSGKQLNVVFQYCTSHSDDLSTQQKRKILIDCSENLLNYYLVDHFNHGKLESAVSEIAKLALTEVMMNFFLVRACPQTKKDYNVWNLSMRLK